MSDGFSEDEKSESEFGPFGTGVKPIRFRFLMMHSHIFTFLTLLCCVPLILTGWYFLYWNYLETESPFIELTKLPAALGSAGNEIAFRMRDRGTGLKSYEVKLVQGEKSVTLVKKDFLKAKDEELLTLYINAKGEGMEEGEANVIVIARDRAFQTNTSTLPVTLKVDFLAPTVEFLTGDKLVNKGGSGFVCYKVSETADILSGVTIGASIFPGQPAKGLHADFTPFPNIYCAFFPIGNGGSTASGGLETIRLFIRDAAGNLSGIDRSLELKAVANKSLTLNLPQDLVENFESETKKPLDKTAFEKAEDLLTPLFVRPKAQVFWNGPFRHPQGQLVWSFGDSVNYTKPQAGAFQIESHEYFLELPERTAIRAVSEGVVIYSDNLGPYGKTLILDHGFGVSTMYSHILMPMKREGDRVNAGDEIAAAGRSGVALDSGYGYAVRIHGVAVRVSDWEDSSFFKSFYSDRLSELRKKLGIREVRYLD